MTRTARLVVGACLLFPATGYAQSGPELYALGCASCHGADGAGARSDAFAFDDPLPDLTDCSFASREPAADWIIVAKAGGPIRGFSESMPAYAEAFDDDQIRSIIEHIRGFCRDSSWPRGELNLPRALVTEKAYPEDEAVWTTRVHAEGLGAVVNEIVYEKRFGARSQIEIKVPFGLTETPEADGMGGVIGSGDWDSGIGDIGLGFKYAAFHDDRSILSLAAEVKLPTSSRRTRLGKDAFVFEPFLAFGQILPSDGFLQVQGGAEFPIDSDAVSTEWFWRAVVGKTFTSGEYGRAWSPMLEILGAREIEDDASVEWDLVPQMQVTLNTRQHIMLNIGVRLPVTDAGERDAEFLVYLLWDWFDGGFFDGW